MSHSRKKSPVINFAPERRKKYFKRKANRNFRRKTKICLRTMNTDRAPIYIREVSSNREYTIKYDRFNRHYSEYWLRK